MKRWWQIDEGQVPRIVTRVAVEKHVREGLNASRSAVRGRIANRVQTGCSTPIYSNGGRTQFVYSDTAPVQS